jgi:hypothetical protein
MALSTSEQARQNGMGCHLLTGLVVALLVILALVGFSADPIDHEASKIPTVSD